MSAIQFTTASRKKSKLRLGIMGAAGSGKTLGALKVAKGIVGDMSKVFVVDTEHGSADLYANQGEYKTFVMSSPFTPIRFSEAIRAAEQAGAECIILDSLSHAWEGEGGELDQVDKKGGNSFTAWKDVTPQHRALVEAILQSNVHIIATLRSKQEYVLEEQTNRSGKNVQVPVRKGMAPVMRAGFEYEMTVFVDVREDHHAVATKDRTGLLDGKLIQLSEQVGADLKRWLDAGVDAPVAAPVVAFTPPRTSPVPAYHPDSNDGPTGQKGDPWEVEGNDHMASNGMTEAFKTINALSARIKAMTTRAEGAKLWTDVEAAAPIIGIANAESLKNDMKAKAKTLTV